MGRIVIIAFSVLFLRGNMTLAGEKELHEKLDRCINWIEHLAAQNRALEERLSKLEKASPPDPMVALKPQAGRLYRALADKLDNGQSLTSAEEQEILSFLSEFIGNEPPSQVRARLKTLLAGPGAQSIDYTKLSDAPGIMAIQLKNYLIQPHNRFLRDRTVSPMSILLEKIAH